MYLADGDIRELLPALDIQTPNASHPFNADEQIQPCSVDLRISDIFWVPSRRQNFWLRPFTRGHATIDLREAHVEELDPRRDWRQVVLREGDTHTIKPMGVLMARIYERFQIPPDLAGKIEGRSSYARLGLFVHCTGDFINPGWGGFMPLQLFNAGPYPITITPYLPICQLKLVRLSSAPTRAYGGEDLESKYVNDDGGPSFWWRDRQVRALQERLGEAHAPMRLQREVLSVVRFKDPELLARFQSFVRKRSNAELENSDALLTSFAGAEDRRRSVDQLAKKAPWIFVPLTLGSVFVADFSAWHVIAIILTILSIPLGLWARARADSGYLGRRELVEARAGQRPETTP